MLGGRGMGCLGALFIIMYLCVYHGGVCVVVCDEGVCVFVMRVCYLII